MGVFDERKVLEDSAHERQGSESGGSVASPPPARDSKVVGRRVAACLVDCTLVAVLSLAAFAPALFVRPGLVLVLVLLFVFVLLFCVLYTIYVTLSEGFWGRTLGTALLSIEVIREEDYGVPGPGRAALRALTFLFVDMFAGIFVMLASPRRQRLGDMAANTLVIRKRSR
jgi:uncharacterized RDD family membrane protein YckC